MTSATELCATLEQRWSACRARVHGDEMIRDFVFCNLWKPFLTRGDAIAMVRVYRCDRPCTSPRRHGCRHGGVMRGSLEYRWTEYDAQDRCEELPW